jgi:hypothetical protein
MRAEGRRGSIADGREKRAEGEMDMEPEMEIEMTTLSSQEATTGPQVPPAASQSLEEGYRALEEQVRKEIGDMPSFAGMPPDLHKLAEGLMIYMNKMITAKVTEALEGWQAKQHDKDRDVFTTARQGAPGAQGAPGGLSKERAGAGKKQAERKTAAGKVNKSPASPGRQVDRAPPRQAEWHNSWATAAARPPRGSKQATGGQIASMQMQSGPNRKNLNQTLASMPMDRAWELLQDMERQKKGIQRRNRKIGGLKVEYFTPNIHQPYSTMRIMMSHNGVRADEIAWLSYIGGRLEVAVTEEYASEVITKMKRRWKHHPGYDPTPRNAQEKERYAQRMALTAKGLAGSSLQGQLQHHTQQVMQKGKRHIQLGTPAPGDKDVPTPPASTTTPQRVPTPPVDTVDTVVEEDPDENIAEDTEVEETPGPSPTPPASITTPLREPTPPVATMDMAMEEDPNEDIAEDTEVEETPRPSPIAEPPTHKTTRSMAAKIAEMTSASRRKTRSTMRKQIVPRPPADLRRRRAAPRVQGTGRSLAGSRHAPPAARGAPSWDEDDGTIEGMPLFQPLPPPGPHENGYGAGPDVAPGREETHEATDTGAADAATADGPSEPPETAPQRVDDAAGDSPQC